MKRLIVYLTLLAYVSYTYATITDVQSTSGSTGSAAVNVSTFTMTLTNNPAVGNWIFGCITVGASTRPLDVTISGATAGNYTPHRFPMISTAAQWGNLFAIPVTTGTTKVITVTSNGGNVNMSGTAVEYSADRGLFADIWKSGTGTSTTAATGTSVATNFPNELLVGCVSTRGTFASSNTGWLTSITGSFSSVIQATTFQNSSNADMGTAQLERIVSATGTQSTGGTLSSNVWGAALYSFSEPTATPTATATATATSTATATATFTPTATPTSTFTPTATATATPTPTPTPTPPIETSHTFGG